MTTEQKKRYFENLMNEFSGQKFSVIFGEYETPNYNLKYSFDFSHQKLTNIHRFIFSIREAQESPFFPIQMFYTFEEKTGNLNYTLLTLKDTPYWEKFNETQKEVLSGLDYEFSKFVYNCLKTFQTIF